MPDLSTLTALRNLQPSQAAEVPMCVLCGIRPAPFVASGTLPDGETAGFVPVCLSCFDHKKAPPTGANS